MKPISTFLLTVLLFVFTCRNIYAIVNPLESQNNKYGIHIVDPTDIRYAQNLVNSNDGDWGYVIFVIRSDERNIERWQEIFNELRRRHMIPIIRIATEQEDNGWKKLTENDIENWVFFLNSLNWVVQNRYVIIGNEPNHALEWGGDINPSEYSEMLKRYSQALKNASSDFFILPAGFDASAPNSKITMSEEEYIDQMYAYDNKIFEYIDGWTSHSYPNPDFSGSEFDSGKGSIQTYRWEISLLKKYKIRDNIPIFITETGWKHNEGIDKNVKLSPSDLENKYDHAFNKVWIDKNIVTINPFLLKYIEPPFDSFSWIDKSNNPFSFYHKVQTFQKERGNPIQISNGEILFSLTPKAIKRGESLQGMLLVKNTGQSIWGEGDFRLIMGNSQYELTNQGINTYLEPGDVTLIPINSEKPLEESFEGNIQLENNGQKFGNIYNVYVDVEDKTTLKVIYSKIVFYISSIIKANEISGTL